MIKYYRIHSGIVRDSYYRESPFSLTYYYDGDLIPSVYSSMEVLLEEERKFYENIDDITFEITEDVFNAGILMQELIS